MKPEQDGSARIDLPENHACKNGGVGGGEESGCVRGEGRVSEGSCAKSH